MNPLPWLPWGIDIQAGQWFIALAAGALIVFVLNRIEPPRKHAPMILASAILAQIFTADGYQLFIVTLPLPDWWVSYILGLAIPIAVSALIVDGFTKSPSARELLRKYVFEPPSLTKRRATLEAEAVKAIEDDPRSNPFNAMFGEPTNVFTGVDGDHLLLPANFPMKGQPSALEKQYQYVKENHPKLVERVEKTTE